MGGGLPRSFFSFDACRSMKKLHERLQKHEMGVSGSEDDEQQEALLKSSGLMPKSSEKEEDDDDSQVINLNLTTPGQQGVMVVVPAVAANAAMYPNSAVSAAVQAAANAAHIAHAHPGRVRAWLGAVARLRERAKRGCASTCARINERATLHSECDCGHDLDLAALDAVDAEG